MLGGGSIFADKYFGDPDKPIKSPLGTEWRGIYERLVAGLESGRTAVGGYYNIKNIQYTDPSSRREYVDVQLLTASLGEETKARFD